MTNKTLVRLTDRAKRWVIAALKTDYESSREDVLWDVTVAVFPDPAATDLNGSLADPSALVPLPALVIYLEIQGANAETSLYISPVLAPYQLDAKRVSRVVEKSLKSMRDQRQQILDSESSS